jgi:uncharacterized protein (UPF0276 family)
MNDEEQELIQRLRKQSNVLENRKRQRDEEEYMKRMEILKKVTIRIEHAIEINLPAVLVSEDDYLQIETYLNQFPASRIKRGNIMDHEEPSVTYVIDLN